LRRLLEEIVPQNSHFNGFEVDHEFPVIGRKTMLLNARRIYRQGKGTEMILLAIEDITERNQAREVLEVSETRYRRLFETAQDGILIIDADTGQISDVNPFLIQMLGYSHEDFSGRKLWEIGAFKDIEASQRAFSELQTRGYVRYEDLPLQTRDGRSIAVEFVSNVYLVDHHKVIQCNIRDITGRKQVEQALRQSEKRYRSYIEVTEQLGWTTNAGGEVVEDIPAWRKFTGQSEEEVKGWGWSKALHPGDLEHATGVWRNAVATRSNYEVEYRIRRYDGAYRHFLVRGVPVFKDDGNTQEWVGTCIDITERNQTEEALRQRSLELQQLTETLEQRVLERTAELAATNEALRHLSTKLLSAQEDERKRIAGELHDTIGSCLSAVKFKVETVQQQIENTANVTSAALNTIIPIVQESIDECRRIQMDLRPSMLDDLGLLPTLSWLCRRFETIYSGIRIEQKIGIEEGEIPNPLKIVIYRVIQEAMNNVAKHSNADFVCLSFRKRDDKLELALQDNGRGFDQEKADSQESTSRGLGLSSMRDRVELSWGSFAIESTEGKGTIIRASWPL